MINRASHQPEPEPADVPPSLRIPYPRAGEKDPADFREPGNLDPGETLFPDERWPRGRPQWVVVVDQLRGQWPGQPSSLAELLETGRARDPEPDLEAEP